MDHSTTSTLSDTDELTSSAAEPSVSRSPADLVTDDPESHPAAVGVGALSAGAAGAALGALGGPVGVVIGAAIGAVAGGLAGHELAETAEDGASSSQLDQPVASPAAGSAAGVESESFLTSAALVRGSSLDGGVGEETIRQAAYLRYLNRQGSGVAGDELSDWYDAEHETTRTDAVAP